MIKQIKTLAAFGEAIRIVVLANHMEEDKEDEVDLLFVSCAIIQGIQ